MSINKHLIRRVIKRYEVRVIVTMRADSEFEAMVKVQEALQRMKLKYEVQWVERAPRTC